MNGCAHDYETKEVIGSDARPGVIEECSKCGKTRKRLAQSTAPRHTPPKEAFREVNK